MYKKSIIIVIVQIIGSVLGLLSIYFIAGNMEPEVYSLTGIYTVMAGITLTFSDLGIETKMVREALYWIEHDEEDKVEEHMSQAILSRIIAFALIVPVLVLYVVIINNNKYNGQYLNLLIIFIFGATINSVNNAMTLMVRSIGGYVFAQIASTFNNFAIKFVGIGIYFWKGAEAYLLFYGLSSIPLSLIYIYKLRRYFSFRYMHFRPTIRKIIDGKYLWLKTDLDYFKNNADSMLVSILFPAGIMGAYTIFKQMEQLSKSIIEGFFDVLSQHTVRFKGNEKRLRQQESKIKRARNVFIVGIVIATIAFSLKSNFLIRLVRLDRYQYIDLMIYCIAFSSICYLLGKYEINAMAFFGSSLMNFKIGIIVFILSCLSFLVVIITPTIYGALIQRIFIYASTSVICIVLFRKNREELYTKVLE